MAHEMSPGSRRREPDLVNRNFTADRPDALCVTDLTYVPTRSGMAYVCFIVDAFSRRIVGWRVAANMRTDMVLDACRWPDAHAATTALSAWSPTRMPGRSSPVCASPNGSTRSAPDRASARSPTASIMRWPRRPTDSSRPSASLTRPTPPGLEPIARASTRPRAVHRDQGRTDVRTGPSGGFGPPVLSRRLRPLHRICPVRGVPVLRGGST